MPGDQRSAILRARPQAEVCGGSGAEQELEARADAAAGNGDRGLMPKLINMHGRKGIVPAGAVYIGR